MTTAKPHSPKRDRAHVSDLRIKAAVKAMMDGTFTVKWFAAERGIAHETLCHKLNPRDERNYHTQELFEDMHLAGPEAARPVLDTIAQEFGGVFVPVPESSPNAESLERLLLIAGKEFGDVLAAYLAATDPRSPAAHGFTEAEWDEIERQLYEGLQAHFRIRALVRQARREAE